MTIIELAREAAALKGHTLKTVLERETVEFIESFAALHRDEIIAELTQGVEMPEPVELNPSANSVMGYRADQYRETVAAAVAKKDAEIAELVKYKNEYCTSHAALQLVKSERDALAAKAIEHRDGRLAALEESAELRVEVARLTAEHKIEHELLDEIGKLLEPVKYEGSYAAGVQVLLAENVRLEADAARYRWLRDNGGRGSNRVPHVTQYPFSQQLNEQEHPHFLVVGLDSAVDAARGEG